MAKSGSSPIFMGRNVGNPFQSSAAEQDPCSIVFKVSKATLLSFGRFPNAYNHNCRVPFLTSNLGDCLTEVLAHVRFIMDYFCIWTCDSCRFHERLPHIHCNSLHAQEWSRMVKDFGRTFQNVAGKPTSIEQARSLKSRRRFYVSRIQQFLARQIEPKR